MRTPLLNRAARLASAAALISCASLACSGGSGGPTLADLRSREPDLTEVEIDDGIDQAMAGYRQYLEEAPQSALTPEAMRRLADLKLEKEYSAPLPGIDPMPDSAAALPPPERLESVRLVGDPANDSPAAGTTPLSRHSSESQSDFEQRATEASAASFAAGSGAGSLSLPGGASSDAAGPLEAIELYDRILESYPNYAQSDQVLYQKARALDELGRVDEAIVVAALLVAKYPESRHLDEVQFRRGEYFFTRKKFFDAEKAYASIVARGAESAYYELALYKLGWSFYKQMMMDESLLAYMELLDHKVSIGYDFDQTEDETSQQRIADTYRVMSLCFSDLGGAESVVAFFDANGARSYEDRVYRQLGEFYLEKLRYNDAASVYEAFVDLYPAHANSPLFSMRVVEIYEAGNFPKLVLASKKKFAASYGLASSYWQHFEPNSRPEVLAYLKSNLADLANHYHALYQAPERPEDKPGHFAESTLWYRAYLSSFPTDVETPGIHYQLADLLLENEDWIDAATEYESIAYEYPEHERSASAGYAAIFAHRQREKTEDEIEREAAQRDAIATTLRFVDRFPSHENSAAVLGAAVDDLYGLEDYAAAIETGHRLIAEYPEASTPIRRAAWMVVAHASFDTTLFVESEQAYREVLLLTADEEEDAADEIRENLAAAIYKQGEASRDALDHRAAADHFLRIAEAAPRSTIRPIAEYDAASALLQLELWGESAAVLESFRTTFPSHELNREATRQIAFVYRQDGQLALAAAEYERVAEEAEEPELQREALLTAGGLYHESEQLAASLAVYRRYVDRFEEPLEAAVTTRFKISEILETTGEDEARKAQLRKIVELDRTAGEARTDVVRLLAARSALILSEESYRRFASIELTLPFEKSLGVKKESMDRALSTFGALIDYEVGEVTAAATFYMAEVYGEFSRALLASERPDDLSAAESEDYEMVLEEEAYPFEEQAIGVHEKNLELMAAGVFNLWIEKSLARLAEVMPGRYAKFEASSGLIESARSYTYRTPQSLLALAAAETPATEASEMLELEPDSASEPSETSTAAAEDAGGDPAEDDLESIAEAEPPADAETEAAVPIEPEGVQEPPAPMPAAPAPAADPALDSDEGTNDPTDGLDTDDLNASLGRPPVRVATSATREGAA